MRGHIPGSGGRKPAPMGKPPLFWLLIIGAVLGGSLVGATIAAVMEIGH